jgi:hypothetical protein
MAVGVAHRKHRRALFCTAHHGGSDHTEDIDERFFTILGGDLLSYE